MQDSYDYVIIGAGIMGLSIARELRQRRPKVKILVLEKEKAVGRHASGRNSGVLHAGIYYQAGSLKARLCSQGAQEMAQYCIERNLPLLRLGKVILPVHPDDDGQLEVLRRRALKNGARSEILDAGQLRVIEPAAHSITGRGLFVPDTAVIDPMAILDRLVTELRQLGVTILFNQEFVSADSLQHYIQTASDKVAYGYLINTAGLFADKIAKAFGIGHNYTIVPFKGIYYDVNKAAKLNIGRLIYPAPNLHVPFLGIHFTRSINGNVFVGPTSQACLGRENYSGCSGIRLNDMSQILFQLGLLYIHNQQGFRHIVHQQVSMFKKSKFVSAAQQLVPAIQANHLSRSKKVGIRAQLVDRNRNELVMDFLVQAGENSLHILNAVSPAFTSAFSFSRYVLDRHDIC